MLTWTHYTIPQFSHQRSLLQCFILGVERNKKSTLVFCSCLKLFTLNYVENGFKLVILLIVASMEALKTLHEAIIMLLRIQLLPLSIYVYFQPFPSQNVLGVCILCIWQGIQHLAPSPAIVIYCSVIYIQAKMYKLSFLYDLRSLTELE